MKRIDFKIARKLVLVPLFIFGLLFNSCEEIIELDPYNQVSETTAFSTPELVELSVVGMYNAAQRGYYFTTSAQYRGYPFGAAFVQQGDCRGEDAVNQQAFYRFTYEGTYDPTTANNVYYWSDTYMLINRCNIVIDGVRTAAQNNVITTEAAERYEGEARLLRAAAYHELLVLFARPYKHSADASHMGVPYHDTPFTTVAAIDEGRTKGRESVAFVYGKILEDLNYAEDKLPLRSGWSGNYQMARGTKGAAAAYKTRIYQHMYRWEDVITEGNKFVTGVYAGEYAMEAAPWLAYGNYGSKEYVFGMQNSGTNNPGVNAALASQYKRRMLVCISPIIWRNSFWLPDDLRRKGDDADDLPNLDEVPDTDMIFKVGGQVYTNKYRDVTNYTDPSPMMRYPEVLLNTAEAYARLTPAGAPDANALALLNEVRDRSLADPANQSYTAADFGTNVDLLEAILAERRIEFVMEGRRWPDIHRLQHCPHFPINGIPAKVANLNPVPAEWFSNPGEFGTGPDESFGIVNYVYDDYRFVWPLPLIETSANPVLAGQQNPGYQ
ncbi:MAG: RagB/SusD family nutrient uptake outer membrane protein [Tenuifilaceae bacterium]|nr:RagB/SusD family nutrient uptake outer membrane protein [Tenuifilaceae bacterium]